MRHEIDTESVYTNYRKARFLHKDLSSHLSLLHRHVQARYFEAKGISSNVNMKFKKDFSILDGLSKKKQQQEYY